NSDLALGTLFGSGDTLMAHLRADYPALAERLLNYRRKGNALGRRGVEKFLDAALFAPALLRKLDEHFDWIDLAAQLFSLSDFAADILIRDPHAICHITENEHTAAPRLPFQSTIASLRIKHREAVLRAVARSLLGESKPFDTFAALTDAAEEALRDALVLAMRDESSARETATTGNISRGDISFESAPFTVIALGRLGSHEFDIGSDGTLCFSRMRPPTKTTLTNGGASPNGFCISRGVIRATGCCCLSIRDCGRAAARARSCSPCRTCSIIFRVTRKDGKRRRI